MQRRLFVTGGTGYMGSALLPQLVKCGHEVRALVRPGSEARVGAGAEICIGDALDGDSYAQEVAGCDTFVHLIGVPHPSPAKAREFVDVDLRAAKEAVRVAGPAGVRHFVYLSVAQPAPVMKAYQGVRAKCECMLRSSGLNTTILRPWYVLGPGHRWPILLKPFYTAAELIPALRIGARRLGLVSLEQMVRTLVRAIEDPPTGIKIFGVSEIRSHGGLEPGDNSWRQSLL
ncbi:MAG: SDR family oxidoreductase [Bryobacteraceae bacterium]